MQFEGVATTVCLKGEINYFNEKFIWSDFGWNEEKITKNNTLILAFDATTEFAHLCFSFLEHRVSQGGLCSVFEQKYVVRYTLIEYFR